MKTRQKKPVSSATVTLRAAAKRMPKLPAHVLEALKLAEQFEDARPREYIIPNSRSSEKGESESHSLISTEFIYARL